METIHLFHKEVVMNIIFIVLAIVVAIALVQVIMIGAIIALVSSDWFVERIAKMEHKFDNICGIEIEYEAEDE
jgi:type IV secretory pathway component VirB8